MKKDKRTPENRDLVRIWLAIREEKRSKRGSSWKPPTRRTDGSVDNL